MPAQLPRHGRKTADDAVVVFFSMPQKRDCSVYGCGSRVGSCTKRFSIQRQGSEVGWALAGKLEAVAGECKALNRDRIRCQVLCRCHLCEFHDANQTVKIYAFISSYTSIVTVGNMTAIYFS
jgi:hypothetical protein